MIRTVASLTALALGLGLSAQEPEPLVEHGDLVSQVSSALNRLAAGDGRAMASLPREAWSRPPALPDPQDADLRRRWTLMLPLAWERGGRPDLGLQEPTTPQDAWDRLLSATASELLRGAAHQAWDRGLVASHQRLLGRLDLPERPRPRTTTPGRPRLLGTAPTTDDARLHPTRHWLLALDPWGRVEWQRPLAWGSRAVGGPEAAVVTGPDGTALIDDHGQRQRLRPGPTADPVAADHAGAWFQAGRTAWWLPRDGDPVALHLPAEPWGPPVVLGARSCWLGDDDLWIADGHGLVVTLPHGLRLGTEAHLAGSFDRLLVNDGLGGWWRFDGAPLEARPSPSPSAAPTTPPRLGPPTAMPPVWQRTSTGGWDNGHHHLTLDRQHGRVEVRCDGSSTWQIGWPALSVHRAPGLTWWIDGEVVLILEGDRRLTAVSQYDGRRRARLDGEGLQPGLIAVDRAGAVTWWNGSELQIEGPWGSHRVPLETTPERLLSLPQGAWCWGPTLGSWWIHPQGSQQPWAPLEDATPPTPHLGGLATSTGWRPWEP